MWKFPLLDWKIQHRYQWSPPQPHPKAGKSSSNFLLRSRKSEEFRNILLSTATRSSCRKIMATALLFSYRSVLFYDIVEGGGGGIKSRWDCYVEVLECILAWWCLGKDAVRSLHKQFSNSVLVEPKELTWQTLGPPLDTTQSKLSSTSVPNSNFSPQYSF